MDGGEIDPIFIVESSPQELIGNRWLKYPDFKSRFHKRSVCEIAKVTVLKFQLNPKLVSSNQVSTSSNCSCRHLLSCQRSYFSTQRRDEKKLAKDDEPLEEPGFEPAILFNYRRPSFLDYEI
ncbi:hypothetical protein NPIL_524551 [Nephila pilipes]|uniref:Uncharacterized protein n=1 Tax=Nephila pilipes TaxID=299642 RepID=A0A8X6UJ69_NEPPI|nr:hypothetical protein NPIL_524551 [Nephila pilipes]